jgi:hypothetical protein
VSVSSLTNRVLPELLMRRPIGFGIFHFLYRIIVWRNPELDKCCCCGCCRAEGSRLQATGTWQEERVAVRHVRRRWVATRRAWAAGPDHESGVCGGARLELAVGVSWLVCAGPFPFVVARLQR